ATSETQPHTAGRKSHVLGPLPGTAAVAGVGLLRCGRVPLAFLHVQATVGRLPLLDAGDRRWRGRAASMSCTLPPAAALATGPALTQAGAADRRSQTPV